MRNMSRDDLSSEIRAVMFMLASEASLDGFDDGLLNSAHIGLMQVIDQYIAERASQPVPTIVKPPRHQLF